MWASIRSRAGLSTAPQCCSRGEQLFPGILISRLTSEGDGCNTGCTNKNLLLFLLPECNPADSSKRQAKLAELWLLWRVPVDALGSSSSWRNLMEGSRKANQQMQHAWGWCAPPVGTGSAGVCPREACAWPLASGFFISTEIKTSQNSKCQKLHCRVCGIIRLLRKQLKVLHSPGLFGSEINLVKSVYIH